MARCKYAARCYPLNQKDDCGGTPTAMTLHWARFTNMNSGTVGQRQNLPGPWTPTPVHICSCLIRCCHISPSPAQPGSVRDLSTLTSIHGARRTISMCQIPRPSRPTKRGASHPDLAHPPAPAISILHNFTTRKYTWKRKTRIIHRVLQYRLTHSNIIFMFKHTKQ